jgi:hypothetical protein
MRRDDAAFVSANARRQRKSPVIPKRRAAPERRISLLSRRNISGIKPSIKFLLKY